MLPFFQIAFRMYDPQKYSRNLDPIIEVERTLYKKYSKLLKWSLEPESIMDLGIGDGRVCKELVIPMIPNNIREFIGTDASDTMLRYAEKTIDHEKFTTLQIDAATKELPIELKNRFHHIFSNFLFPYIKDIR